MRTIEDLLTESPLLGDLRADQLSLIAGCAKNVRFEAGEAILREGTPADTFYLLRSGSVLIDVAVPGKEALTIETIHAGETLGWSWLFEPYRVQFDGHAREPVAAIAFDALCLRGKCDANHELGYELMRRFAGVMLHSLQAARFQLLDVYGHAGTR